MRKLRKKKQSMKRYGNLYDQIISLENLNLADQKARKGKTRSYGVRFHDKNRVSNINSLHADLKNNTYKTSEYDIFTIHEPKERQIYRLPFFPDRIVHHAIMNVLEPIWIKTFTNDSYSCIKGKGIHAAMKCLKRTLMEDDSANYCLKIDIRKFYPSISHSILKEIIRRKIKCKQTLQLLDEIIESTEGVPIGNYVSQYFANLYLTYFDHWIKQQKRIKHYFRYADDCVFLAETKEELHQLLAEIKTYLEEELKLELKGNYQVFPIAKLHRSKDRGIDFVGYVFYKKETRIRKSIKKNYCKKVAKLNKKDMTERTYITSICSWLGWLKYSNAKYLLKKTIKEEHYEIIAKRF